MKILICRNFINDPVIIIIATTDIETVDRGNCTCKQNKMKKVKAGNVGLNRKREEMIYSCVHFITAISRVILQNNAKICCSKHF